MVARELDACRQEVQKYGRETVSLHRWVRMAIPRFGDLIEIPTPSRFPMRSPSLVAAGSSSSRWLETLSPREAGVIKMRYGGRRPAGWMISAVEIVRRDP